MMVDHSGPLASFVFSVWLLFTLGKATGQPSYFFDGSPNGLPEDSQPHVVSPKNKSVQRRD